MTERMKQQKTKEIFEQLCAFLDTKKWRYNADEEKRNIAITLHGEDIPMDLLFRLDADRQLIRAFSIMPYEVPTDKRLEVAVALTAINNKLVDSCFTLDLENGKVMYRMAVSYLDSEIGNETLAYMVDCSCVIVDEFNDQIMMLSKGVLSLEKFIEMNKA